MMSRIVLVTGGGNGLGRAVAARFLADGDAVSSPGGTPGGWPTRRRRSGRSRSSATRPILRRWRGWRATLAMVIARAWSTAGGITYRPKFFGLVFICHRHRRPPRDAGLRAAGCEDRGAGDERVAAALTPRSTRTSDGQTCSARSSPLPPCLAGARRAGGPIVNVGSIGRRDASTSYGAAKAAAGGVPGVGLSAEVGARGLTRQRHLTGPHRRDRLLPRQADRGAEGPADQGHP